MWPVITCPRLAGYTRPLTTMKNVINLDHYYLPWQLEHQVGPFVDYYNHHRVH